MRTNQVFFSVCIPTYNSVKYLKRLLNSLFSQSFFDFEIVISDDSTTDEVMNFCSEIEDHRIRYFKHKSLRTATENWNYALQNAKGKYRMLVHHDDYFYNEYCLEEIYQNCIGSGEKDAYFLGFKNENLQKRCFYNQFVFKSIKDEPSKLLFVNYLSAPSCLVLHENVKINYDSNLKWLVDVEFYKRLFLNYSLISYLPEIKMVIGGGDERITNSISKNEILYEYFYLSKQNIYKYQLGIYFVKYMKFRIYLTEYFRNIIS